MPIEETTKCRFRGEEMAIADARMQLTADELAEVEVTQPDGTVIRPFRFNEPNPEVRRDPRTGILKF